MIFLEYVGSRASLSAKGTDRISQSETKAFKSMNLKAFPFCNSPSKDWEKPKQDKVCAPNRPQRGMCGMGYALSGIIVMLSRIICVL